MSIRVVSASSHILSYTHTHIHTYTHTLTTHALIPLSHTHVSVFTLINTLTCVCDSYTDVSMWYVCMWQLHWRVYVIRVYVTATLTCLCDKYTYVCMWQTRLRVYGIDTLTCVRAEGVSMSSTGTGWHRVIGCHIFIGRFPQKSPIISGSFA